MIHKIRTTMQPDVELEVEDTEYLDLKRQGLIAVDYDEQTPAEPEQAAAPAPAVTKKAAPPAPSKEN